MQNHKKTRANIVPNGTALEETHDDEYLPIVSEVENAKCECCGMCEECTREYIRRVRDMFSGRLICGLCAEAVSVEMEKNGGKREKAVKEHMSDCVKFNRLGRSYPALYLAEDVKEILKKTQKKGHVKAGAQGR